MTTGTSKIALATALGALALWSCGSAGPTAPDLPPFDDLRGTWRATLNLSISPDLDLECQLHRGDFVSNTYEGSLVIPSSSSPASGTVQLHSGVGECRQPIHEPVTLDVGSEIVLLNALGGELPTGRWSVEATGPGGSRFPDELVEAATGCVPRANAGPVLHGDHGYIYTDYSTIRVISIFRTVVVDCPFADPAERAVTLSFSATGKFADGVWTFYPPSLPE